MEDLAGKKRTITPERQKALDAVRTIAETQAGKIFFRALAKRCFMFGSTITGDPQTHEINPYGTFFNEAQRRVYLDIRRDIPKGIRKNIEEGL